MLRRGLAWLVTFLAAALILCSAAGPAVAAGDEIDDFDISYRVDRDGLLHVTERITYRFGSYSGRHGIERELITREPDQHDPDTDIVYEVSRPEVSSPDGVPVDLKVERDRSADRRTEITRFRIGDPDQTVDAAVATYVLEYTVEGALRTSGDYDELYWDATGFDWDAKITQVSVAAEVPGGAEQVSCYAGSVGATTGCDNAVVRDGVGHLLASDLQPGEGMTIGVRIAPGLVADNSPHRTSAAVSTGTITLIVLGALSAVITIGVPILGRIKITKIGRDERYLDLPPGSFPTDAKSPGAVGPSPSGLEPPVRFQPPDLAVGLTGVLSTGQIHPRDLAATVVQLAIRGAIKINDTGKGFRRRDRFQLELIDPALTEVPSENAVLQGIFALGDDSDDGSDDDGGRGTVTFGDRKRFREGYRDFSRSVRGSAGSGRWFLGSVPTTSKARRGWIVATVLGAILIAAAVISGQLGPACIGVPMLACAVTLHLVRRRSRYGARSARGRAWTDQVEGFRTYLATAEADQLRYEEGQDIFSAYLPWAIAFGLAERWTRVCQTLAEQDKVPAPAAGWYSGVDLAPVLNASLFSAGIGSASAPAPFSGSGSGFGGGSSFSGGGGFAGGGGGGGGGGSW